MLTLFHAHVSTFEISLKNTNYVSIFYVDNNNDNKNHNNNNSDNENNKKRNDLK